MADAPVFKLVNVQTNEEVALSTAGSLVWSLTAGVAPNTSNFKLIEPRAVDWARRVIGPVELHFAEKKFKGLFLTRVIKATQSEVFLRIADVRQRFKYSKHFGKYNMRRPSGDLFTVVQDAAGDAAIQSSKNRYLFWSLNGDKPWTSLELAKHILKSWIAEKAQDPADLGYEPKVFSTIRDNGHIPMDADLTGSTIVDCIRPLLSQADAELTVTAEGDLFIHNPRARVEGPGGAGALESVEPVGGVLSRPDLQRLRPKAIEVFFVKERERRVRGLRRGDTVRGFRKFIEDKATDLFATNVCQIPFAATINGVSYPANSFVSHIEVTDFLASDEAGDSKLHNYLGEESLLKAMAWGGSEWATLWAHEPIANEAFWDTNPKKYKWAAALLGSFGKLWQCRSDWFMHIYSWTPETTEFVDEEQGDIEASATSTWVRRPSPVYTEWWEARRLYFNLKANFKTGFTTFDSFETTPFEKSPFVVTIRDKARGVFELQSVQDVSGFLSQREIGYMEKVPTCIDVKNRWKEITTQPQATLRGRPQMQVIMTFIEGSNTDNAVTPPGTHREIVRGDPKGSVSSLQLFHRVETAKFDVANRLRNRGIIKDIANAEAKVALDTYADRPIGTLQLAFKSTDEWRVTGHLTAITFSYIGGKLGVSLTAADSIPRQNMFGQLPLHVRSYLLRSELESERPNV